MNRDENRPPTPQASASHLARRAVTKSALLHSPSTHSLKALALNNNPSSKTTPSKSALAYDDINEWATPSPPSKADSVKSAVKSSPMDSSAYGFARRSKKLDITKYMAKRPKNEVESESGSDDNNGNEDDEDESASEREEGQDKRAIRQSRAGSSFPNKQKPLPFNSQPERVSETKDSDKESREDDSQVTTRSTRASSRTSSKTTRLSVRTPRRERKSRTKMEAKRVVNNRKLSTVADEAESDEEGEEDIEDNENDEDESGDEYRDIEKETVVDSPSTRRTAAISIKDDGASDLPETESSKRKREVQKMDDEDDAGAATYERYFQELNGTKTSKTSNNTLSKLPPLNHKEYLDVLSGLPQKQEEGMRDLAAMNQCMFYQWFFEIQEGYNLLMYGFGSKRGILNQFAMECLTDAPVIVANGFFPSFNIRDVLVKIMGYLGHVSELPKVGNNAPDLLAFILNYFDQEETPHVPRLYLLVHNIDGSNLRNDKAQGILASLASSKRICVIASTDHINTTLLWDTAKSSRLNWVWHDVTTFEDYVVETKNENNLMVKREKLGGRGVQFVLASLTTNARHIFKLLATHHLNSSGQGGDADNDNNNDDDDDRNTSNFEGISYSSFYEHCRENFLVSNDLTFRTQLTEFLDHEMVQSRRGVDGTEMLFIPLERRVLKNVIEKL